MKPLQDGEGVSRSTSASEPQRKLGCYQSGHHGCTAQRVLPQGGRPSRCLTGVTSPGLANRARPVLRSPHSSLTPTTSERQNRIHRQAQDRQAPGRSTERGPDCVQVRGPRSVPALRHRCGVRHADGFRVRGRAVYPVCADRRHIPPRSGRTVEIGLNHEDGRQCVQRADPTRDSGIPR